MRWKGKYMEYLHDMSREELIKIIERQEQEMIILEAVKKQYMKHLEKVIEYHSVGAYRNLVQKNREGTKVTSLHNNAT